MDLDFTSEQDMLREMVRGVCGTYSPLDTVRALEDDAVGYSTELWSQLATLDLIGLMLPTEYGGSGMSTLEGAVVYEEFGRALVSSPHFVSAVMGAGAILRAGTTEQRSEFDSPAQYLQTLEHHPAAVATVYAQHLFAGLDGSHPTPYLRRWAPSVR